jgi:hypothetical protein
MAHIDLRNKVIKSRLGGVIALMICLTACASPTVVISTPEPGPSPAKPELSRPISTTMGAKLSEIPFTIQAGAFTTASRAARYSIKLQDLGVDAYYIIDTDGLYKVRFQRFEDKESARRRALELQALGRIDDFCIIEPVSKQRRIDPRESLRQNIVKTAHRFIGTSYRWGGESASSGFDCSGLTMTVYRLNGLELPRNSRSQFNIGTRIQRDELQKGDLVFFATDGRRRVSHVGIYTGQSKFIHASGRGKRIRTSSLSNTYFKKRYMGARRYF